MFFAKFLQSPIHHFELPSKSEMGYTQFYLSPLVEGEKESIYNLVNKYEITLSEILTIRPNSFFLGSIYLVSEKIKDAGESIQNDEDYESLVRELIRDYAGLLNE